MEPSVIQFQENVQLFTSLTEMIFSRPIFIADLNCDLNQFKFNDLICDLNRLHQGRDQKELANVNMLRCLCIKKPILKFKQQKSIIIIKQLKEDYITVVISNNNIIIRMI